MPKISVIVPVYNAERWLDACVESVLAQTFEDWECVLVDDGSKDGSAVLCDAWAAKDCRVRVVHKQNEGPSVARRTGVQKARAELLMFLDSDDTIEPVCLEKMYDAMTAHDADMVVCNFRREREDGTAIPTPGTEVIPGVFTGKEICKQFMQVNVTLTILPTKLYRRAVLERIVYPAKERLVEDEAIAHQLMYPCRRVVCMPEALYHYIDHESNATNSVRIATVRLLDPAHAFLDRMRYFREKNEAELFRDAAMVYAYSLYVGFWRMPAKKLGEFSVKLKVLRREFAAEETAAMKCKALPFVHKMILRLSVCPVLLWLAVKTTQRFVL